MKQKKENMLAALTSLIVAVLFGFNSPLHPWVGKECYTDSSVFKTVTLMMQHGFLPYKDTFDHKGPLLYLINLVGNKISYYKGIWVVEVITLMITFFVMYKIARLCCGILPSTVSTLTAISLLFLYYEGGNLTEEYAMPFIAISLYIFLDYFGKENINRLRLISVGVCFGAILLLRPNMISLWIVFCISVICHLIFQGKVTKLLSYTGWFLLGTIAICFPICLWLLIKQDFSCFIRDYILFNLKYSSKENAVLQQKWIAFFTFTNSKVYTVAIISILIHLKKNKTINISYMAYLLLTVVMMVMSGRQFNHYGMILIPALVYPISLIYTDVENIDDKKLSQGLVALISILLLSSFVLPSWQELFMKAQTVYEERNESHVDNTIKCVVGAVKELTDEKDAISVYGNWDIIYVLSHRIHATRYSYQVPIGAVMPEILNEYITQLDTEVPPVIVVEKGFYDDRIEAFLNEHQYELYLSMASEGTTGDNKLDCTLVYRRQSNNRQITDKEDV